MYMGAKLGLSKEGEKETEWVLKWSSEKYILYNTDQKIDNGRKTRVYGSFTSCGTVKIQRRVKQVKQNE
jgi:hypothetical protein